MEAVEMYTFLPLIWILISGSRLISQWINPNPSLLQEEAYLSGNYIDRIVLGILIIFGLYVLYTPLVELGCKRICLLETDAHFEELS